MYRLPFLGYTKLQGDGEAMELNSMDKPRPAVDERPMGNGRPGWRKTVGMGAILAFLVLLINFIVLGWSTGRPRSDKGYAMLWEGDCNQRKTISIVVDFLINSLSTLLLGASNAAMQCLSAPTRKEIDSAHAKGKSLHIGVPGFVNFVSMSLARRAAWLLLLLSSVPLHLLYNSVIFSTIQGNSYLYSAVSPSFLHGATFDPSILVLSAGQITRLTAVQASVASDPSNFANLSASDCINAYNQPYVSDYRNLLLFTNSTEERPVSASQEYDLSGHVTSMFSFAPATDPSNWVFHVDNVTDPATNISESIFYSIEAIEEGEPPDDGRVSNFKVEYCLAEKVASLCSVQLIPQLLGIVIACNVVKLLCMFILFLGVNGFEPLVTIGDAIASFLRYPDSTTEERGAVPVYPAFGRLENVRYRWFRGVGWKRWLVTLFLCLSYWAIGLGLLYMTTQTVAAEQGSLFTMAEFGTIQSNNAITSGDSILQNILLANTPQLWLSFVYLSYNQLLTCLLLSNEWTSFSAHRKGLRVSKATGDQRRSYWLSLPYRFSLPLLLCSGILHWLISESIFLAEVNALDINGIADDASSINTVVWSAYPIAIALGVGGSMILALVAMAAFCRYQGGIPIVRSSSVAISGACHPIREGEAEKRLQFGVLEEMAEDRGRVGFSSGPVTIVRHGWLYR